MDFSFPALRKHPWSAIFRFNKSANEPPGKKLNLKGVDNTRFDQMQKFSYFCISFTDTCLIQLDFIPVFISLIVLQCQIA